MILEIHLETYLKYIANFLPDTNIHIYSLLHSQKIVEMSLIIKFHKY